MRYSVKYLLALVLCMLAFSCAPDVVPGPVAGDIMLYSGNCIVLFYGPAGGYSYTRIGRLQSAAGLAAALGSGTVTVVFGT